jgi:hypothetical protein
MHEKPASTKMSRSEMAVTGLAAAMLIAGFATGVFAKPAQSTTPKPWQSPQVQASQETQARD